MGPMDELLIRPLARNLVLLVLAASVDILSRRGTRPLLCIGVVFGAVVLGVAQPVFNTSVARALVAMLGAGVAAYLLWTFARLAPDPLILIGLVLQAVGSAWLLESGNPYSNGALGIPGPGYELSSVMAMVFFGWVAVSLISTVIGRELFWRSRRGRYTDLLSRDEILGNSLGLSFRSVGPFAITLSSGLLLVATAGWTFLNAQIQPEAFSLEMAVLVTVGVLAGRRYSVGMYAIFLGMAFAEILAGGIFLFSRTPALIGCIVGVLAIAFSCTNPVER